MWLCAVLLPLLLLSTPSVTTLEAAAGLTDMDAQLLAVIPVISTRINGSPSSTPTSTTSTSCVTPEGHQGVCGLVSECLLYSQLVQDIHNKSVVQFFLNRVCKALPNAIHICCPQIGIQEHPATLPQASATGDDSRGTTQPQSGDGRPSLGVGPPRTDASRPQSSGSRQPADRRPQLGSARPSQPGSPQPSRPGNTRPSLQRPNSRQPAAESRPESSLQEIPVNEEKVFDQRPPPPPVVPPQLQPRPTARPQLQPQPTTPLHRQPLPPQLQPQPPQVQPQLPPTPAPTPPRILPPQLQPAPPQQDSQHAGQTPPQPGQQQPQVPPQQQPIQQPPQQQPTPPSDKLTADQRCGVLPPGFVEGDPWPWTVEVMGGGTGCGGTLITSAHILAPAHCLSNPQRIEVVVGGRVKPVLPIFHPEYDPFTHANDLALLTLPSPLTHGQHGGELMPLCLPFRYSFDGFRYQTLTRIPPPASQIRLDRVEVEEVEVVGLHDCKPSNSPTSTFPNKVEVQQRKHLCAASTLATSSSLCDAGGSSLIFHDDYDTGLYYLVGVGSLTNSCTPQSSAFRPAAPQSSPTFPGSSAQTSPSRRPQTAPVITNESRPSLIIPGISAQQRPPQTLPGVQKQPPRGSEQPSAAHYSRVGAYLDWIVEQVNGQEES